MELLLGNALAPSFHAVDGQNTRQSGASPE